MDPNRTLYLIGEHDDEGNRKQAAKYSWDLYHWLLNGGFEPDWDKDPYSTSCFHDYTSNRDD